jgi:phage terminase small subunit
MSSKLNKQTEQFCQEYIIDLNGKQAAIRAGYSAKTAEVKASQLLRLVKVQKRVQELMKAREERTEITGDIVIKELAKLALSDIRKLYDGDRLLLPHELDDNTAATISSFKTKREGNAEEGFYEIEEYKRYDKTKSLELLGRHFGLFNDKLKIETEFNLEKFVKELHDSTS